VINASGRVAFWASTYPGERIVFAENGQVHTVIDTTISTYDGVGFAELGDPALNDSGGIAFWAHLDNGLQGVFFVDPAGNLSRVIQETDSLAGSKVWELGFGSNGLSKSGKLAVWAELEDGTEVVLRLDSPCSSGVDEDADGVDDACDNCLLIPNPTQLDAGHDGYGNACDPDLNNDGVVNFADLAAMKKVFFKADAFADLNGDGVVNFADLAIMKKAFFKAPGPAAGKP
jgi:hypothetical protein